jgi:hypothetical protein
MHLQYLVADAYAIQDILILHKSSAKEFARHAIQTAKHVTSLSYAYPAQIRIQKFPLLKDVTARQDFIVTQTIHAKAVSRTAALAVITTNVQSASTTGHFPAQSTAPAKSATSTLPYQATWNVLNALQTAANATVSQTAQFASTKT